jgi:Na+/melibiose symporter-like transporter
MRGFLIVIGFAMLAAIVFSVATAGTIFFSRRRMDAASWNVTATVAAWASVCVIVLSQGLMSHKTANILVPSLLILVSLAAAWKGIHFLRRIW